MFEMQHDETKAVNETKSYDSIKKKSTRLVLLTFKWIYNTANVHTPIRGIQDIDLMYVAKSEWTALSVCNSGKRAATLGFTIALYNFCKFEQCFMLYMGCSTEFGKLFIIDV